MIRKTVIILAGTVFAAVGVLANATVDANVSEWAFSGLLSEANETTRGWYFSSGGNLSPVTMGGVSFTGVTPVSASGSSGELSWNSAAGYYNGTFVWSGASEQAARDAMSQGGLWSDSDGVMSLDIAMTSGQEYLIEIVSLQPYGSGVRSMDIVVDGTVLLDDWTVPAEPAFNQLLRFSGTSDGNIDIDFSLGGSGDPAPAFSIITVTQVPEPVSVALLGVVTGAGFFIRRRFLA